MEHFSNETLDIEDLPKYEEVPFSRLHTSYWSIIFIQILVLGAFLLAGLEVAIANIPELLPYHLQFLFSVLGFVGLFILFLRIGYAKKGYAFREHDVLFKHGVIATTIIIIPYNRIQHVALHEGFFSRFFNLAAIEIFTAGGNSSDIEIPGILKGQAESIKQLLMGKIQKEL